MFVMTNRRGVSLRSGARPTPMTLRVKRRKRPSTSVPSFVGLKPASEAASRSKRANRKRNTRPELLLRKAAWALGLRFRTHVPGLPGNPDLVFARARVVVFCDGDFWHGREWRRLRVQLLRRHNSAYWIAKIRRNRKRDREQTSQLIRAGWMVLRLWETEIVHSPNSAAAMVLQLVRSRIT